MTIGDRLSLYGQKLGARAKKKRRGDHPVVQAVAKSRANHRCAENWPDLMAVVDRAAYRQHWGVGAVHIIRETCPDYLLRLIRSAGPFT